MTDLQTFVIIVLNTPTQTIIQSSQTFQLYILVKSPNIYYTLQSSFTRTLPSDLHGQHQPPGHPGHQQLRQIRH